MKDVTPLLVDSHAHLDSGQYKTDLDDTIARAAANGISHILTIGCDIESSAASISLAQKYDNIYAAVGVHPHDAREISPTTLQQLEQMLAESKVVALGEIGLDYFRNHCPHDIQQQAFREQIRLARKVNKPIIIHDRDAHEDLLRIMEEENAGDVGGVVHCFSGDTEMARRCIDLGFYISFTGNITYPKNEALREVVKNISIDKMLVETDCPYLSPQGHRGKRNEPAHVRLCAEQIATTKGLTYDDVARITSRNCHDLFGFGQIDQSHKIAYQIRNSLYLNVTNRCTNSCIFCAKFKDFVVKGHELYLDHEPDASEVIAAIGDPSRYDEVVFCGYGEPLLRLDLIKEVAEWLKESNITIRINTDGQANLVHKRNILPELKGLVDAISVSLNASDAETYQSLCQSDFGLESYTAVKEFIRQAPQYIPEVVASAVSYPDINMDDCRKIAEELGVPFREREYNELG